MLGKLKEQDKSNQTQINSYDLEVIDSIDKSMKKFSKDL
jgi:hypothetical protein